MAYATVGDFELAFGTRETLQLSNRDNAATATVVNAAVLEEFLEGASGLIDTYLGAKYVTPVVTPTQPLKQACLDITRYQIDNVRVREDVRQRYEDRIRWLEMIVKSQIQLGLPVIPGASTLGGGVQNGAGSTGLGQSRSSVDTSTNFEGFGFDRTIRGSNYR
jgi:phage gp36-like protein